MLAGWYHPRSDFPPFEIRLSRIFRRLLSGLTVGLLLFTIQLGLARAQQSETADPLRQPGQPWRVAFGSVNDRPANTTSQSLPQDGRSNSSGENNIPLSASQNSTGTSNLQDIPGQTNPSAVGQSTPSLAAHTDLTADVPRVAAVGRTMNQLPNSAGQVWREYDITPYTSRISSTDHPQQAIIDWILKETGKEMWFHHPMGILNATPFRLYVYHTPEVQSKIQPLIDRFVASGGKLQSFEISMMTIEKPNWRSSAYSMLQPIETRSLGVEAWLVSKENAAILQSQLARRFDAKPLQSGTSNQHEGQPTTLQRKQPIQFVGQIQWMPELNPPFQPQITTVDVGYEMSFHFLTDRGGTVEALIDAEIDQIEKLTNVKLDVPGVMGNAQDMNIQVPSVLSWRLNERFRWPSDHVLLVSCGVVSQLESDRLPSSRPSLPFFGDGLKLKRADALMFINYRGPTASPALNRSAKQELIPLR